MYKILLATDGSDYSLQSLKKIIPIARGVKASITILAIAEEILFQGGTGGMSKEEIDLLFNTIKREAESGLIRATELFESEGLKVETLLRAGKPAEAICEEAEKGGFDLIVVGDSGLGGLKEFFLGSVSNKVAHRARTDVMIMKRQASK